MHVNGGALSGSSPVLDTVLVEMPRSRAQRNAQADRYDGQTCCVSHTVGTQGRGAGRGQADTCLPSGAHGVWHKACVMIFLYLMTVDLKVTGVDWVVGGFLAAILPTRHIQHHLVNNILGNTWFGSQTELGLTLHAYLLAS